ncbi:TIGR03960 family B12-binding radical SAM protein [Lachnotalea glycerini]|uniref:TIGR03960 family B12-binding radical SAM protein n=1 Tax=Lachnotalea glycerini TaxID=1763509 RepID=A0A371JJ86_9FIRM|nr:TIGR03960 family B12-binding radical SAM protein [Lachnotalea glycerini]RDY32767.1 TIGR03960 family B12-binding radical SAM protein [Lachnotalea glycerini]
MRKTALTDEILLSIDKPARYIGNEVNSVIKDLTQVNIRFAMCFPDVYEIGMSHLGIQILYDMFNQMEDVYCERVYSPWTDLDKIMRERNIPLFALESQDPIKAFDFLGITIQYEMCYTNILQVLELSQIPLLASERGEEFPIVIGGGPCTYNPEPLADFFDLFYIGEGETSYFPLLEAYRENKKNGGNKLDFLKKAAQIPGIYVPSFYDVKYKEDGTVKEFTPNVAEAPKTIRKEIVMDVSETFYPKKPVVPFIKATQDRVVLEIQRGCIRGCRFCQAGMIYRPVRERSLDMLKEYAYEMLHNTGYEEISLSSLSSSDYSQLQGLVNFLIEEFKEQGVNISLPSLRIDEFSLDVMSKVQDVRKSSLTFAPEAGTQRLRDVINKGLTEEVIIEGAGKAFESGWNRVKLYFMLGLPTETLEDMVGIAELSDKIARRYYEIPKDQRNGKVQIVASTSFFVPKPFTPFQWATMSTKEEFIEKARIVKQAIKSQLNQKSIKYNWHEADLTVLEGVLARGDRRVSKVILQAYRNGCIYDAWSETFDYSKWLAAFENTGVDINFYTTRERTLDEIFPWDFIDTGVTKEFLKREWENAKNGLITLNCKMACSGCGAMIFNGGVCFEDKN